MTDKGKKPFDISGELYLNEVDQTTQKAVDEQTDLSIDLKDALSKSKDNALIS